MSETQKVALVVGAGVATGGAVARRGFYRLHGSSER
jgi:hypothetical protein